MFFIYGWGRQTIGNDGTAGRRICSNCNNEVDFQLVKRKTWGTLFFIPVLPYKTEHLVVCPICSSYYAVDGACYKLIGAQNHVISCKTCPSCGVSYNSSGMQNCPKCWTKLIS